MRYKTLREKVQKHEKYAGTKQIERCPLVNPGFKDSFNVSFGEDPLLKYQGGYVNFKQDFPFSTIQSCIRHEDIDKIVENEFAWKYLGVFEMADISGAVSLKSEPKHNELARYQISNLIKLLRDLGISPSRVYPSYCAGGKVIDLTKGKYNFNFDVPEDTLSKEAFICSGVPQKNLVADRTRDTFLSLNLDERPTGWGYRNEININIGTQTSPILLDIGTHEYFRWQPIYQGNKTDSKSIAGLEDYKGRFSIAAVGLERLNMVINDLTGVQDVDYIQGFYDKLEKVSGRDYVVGEALRTLHRIYSDVINFNLDLGRRKHTKRATVNKLIRSISSELTKENIRELLKVNAGLQPWHSNLDRGIEATVERILEYRSNQDFNKVINRRK